MGFITFFPFLTLFIQFIFPIKYTLPNIRFINTSYPLLLFIFIEYYKVSINVFLAILLIILLGYSTTISPNNTNFYIKQFLKFSYSPYLDKQALTIQNLISTDLSNIKQFNINQNYFLFFAIRHSYSSYLSLYPKFTMNYDKALRRICKFN